MSSSKFHIVNSSNLTQLVELDLSDNAFGPDGAEAIRSLLTSPVAYTIQTLKFQNNGLGGGGVVRFQTIFKP